ncbi:BF3164 family lipoprotein [Belliella kenyensis]|uniref:BF3164 family lipoprotein n=1 Tax=Belliella kenyensis TaxID=1472724 RepID=A0ABV8EGM3_9BACT|nr:BF3164 family lipoprotein [Belliella kenyensis]MCH7402354.1 TolB-like 6-bladed beta-propeller domain-containing protein [Belliella kenyensis]MDN3603546.1 BF3164 family lipoprotein [Belliella kenyensis]
MIRYLFILILILFQCTQKSDNQNRPGEHWVRITESDLPQKTILKGEPFGITNFQMTRKPFFVDGYIVVSDKAMDPPLHIIGTKEKKWLYGLGIEGSGPGEVAYTWTLDYSFTPGNFWAYSFEKVFSEFSLSDSTQKLSQNQLKQRNPEFYAATEITWLTDSTLLALRVSGEEKFVEYSKSGKVLAGYGSWKGMLPDDNPLNVTRQAFANHFTSNRSKTKFGFFSMDRDHFEILDYSSKEILVVEGPYFENPSYEIIQQSEDYSYYHMNDPEAVRTYQDFFLGEHQIFMLYSGEKVKKIQTTGMSPCHVIFLFDYTGKVTRHFELDIPIKYFTVDEKNKVIYGLSSSEDEDIIEFRY